MSLYRAIRLIGSSSNSWEEVAKSALEEAATHLEDFRVAEVEQLDIRMQENKVVEYRARVRASFRYHPWALIKLQSARVDAEIERRRHAEIGTVRRGLA